MGAKASAGEVLPLKKMNTVHNVANAQVRPRQRLTFP